ncbi:MAG: hypothetical protein ACLPX9_21735 [Rhodomicrobium sp.]
MGICICEKHGRAGIVEVCPHAGDLIDKGRYGDFHLIDVLGLLLVCEECFRGYNLQQFENRPRFWEHPDEQAEEAYLGIYERLEGRRVKCAECVATAEVAQARRDGKPDPFPVFERTLTANHREVLEQLEAHLIHNFDFEPSIVEHQRKERAVFVQGGNYREPLTVTVYYVTAADKQEQIASLIADFLAAFELNQCRIRFFQAEIWITTYNAEKRPSGAYRGQETLLREIFLNC